MSDPKISADDESRYMQVMAAYDEAMRQEAIKISARKATDHFTQCRDCGHFTHKGCWVPTDSDHASRGARPLCDACADEYDDLYY